MPRRWTDLDSDECRLPEGFRRVGYDADERRYYFLDRDGQTWRSEPGNEYGTLTPVWPEPPVTIPRRPPPYSREAVEDPPPRAFMSTFNTFQEVLRPDQVTSAPAPRRSQTINIPSLKRSSTTAASFIRSQRKRFSKSLHSKEQSNKDNPKESPHPIHHRRSASLPVIVRRSATTFAAYVTGRAKSGNEPADGDPPTTARK